MTAATETTFEPQEGLEVLPGYTLREKIGSGGFGEVWRAEAPGGLDKAIKFVFGRVGESRASSELEALERIRDLRHPFILSTERIEVVDNTLLIVLELAEGNLKELYDKHRQDGFPGIPASELLTFIRDSADALDYLWSSQSLQHLDIKPENLMLSGGRVKIGDFGLVKEISDDDSTVLGGVTPAYAPPELFDGRPCGFSDQYSLAICYQELLTGQLPFRGRTAAQLAMQHTHHPPQLDTLPIPVRPVIRRALSKNPEQRYPSCREMVDALYEANEKRHVKIKTSARSGGNSGIRQLLNYEQKSSETRNSVALVRTVRKTNLQDGLESTQVLNSSGDGQNQAAALPSTDSLTGTSIPLGPINLNNELVAGTRPVIAIGVGSTGLKVIAQFKREIGHIFGNQSVFESNPVLGIDVDDRTIRDAASGKFGDVLLNNEVLRIPLRTSHDYRENGRGRLRSISRRWLFNVPRSLQTEGMRPFGRLAFIDNYEKVVTKIEQVIDQVISARQAESESASHIGLPPEDQPTVLLVGSICGGACGGMINELGYLVKDRLRARGLASGEVSALLSYSMGRDDKNSDLAAGNALAYLVELQKYLTSSEGYKGDIAAGIPPAHCPEPPFDQVNFVHVGRAVEGDDQNIATESLVDYLAMHVTDPGSKYIRASRTNETKLASRQLQLRSFAIGQASMACLVSPLIKGQYLCHHLFRSYIGSGDAKNDLARSHRDDIVRWTKRSLKRIGSTPDELAGFVQTQLLRKMKVSEQKLISRCARTAVATVLGAKHDLEGREIFERLLVEIDRTFRSAFDRQGENKGTGFSNLVTHVCQPLINRAVKNFTEWQTTLVDTMKIRLPGAQFAADSCLSMLKSSAASARDRQTGIATKRERSRDAIFRTLVMILSPSATPAPDELNEDVQTEDEDPLSTLSKLLEDYTRSRLEEACMKVAEKTYESTIAGIEPRFEWLGQLEQKLDRLLQRFVVRNSVRAATNDDAKSAEESEQDIEEVFRGRLDDFLSQLDEEVTHEYFEKSSPLSAFVDTVGAEQLALGRICETSAVKLVESATNLGHDPMNESESEKTEGHDSWEPSITLGEAIGRIAPPEAIQGRYHRVLVMTPGVSQDATLSDRIHEAMGTTPTVLSHQALNVTFLLESYAVDLARLARHLYDDNETRVELAERLHTRDDE